MQPGDPRRAHPDAQPFQVRQRRDRTVASCSEPSSQKSSIAPKLVNVVRSFSARQRTTHEPRRSSREEASPKARSASAGVAPRVTSSGPSR
ncbi:MAG TPA: hypothetical protein VF533_13055 [Solirubrobacteraceae bacterium]|jgi:hypothetical protein